jgi:ectoine hydroxylase-related dioxygenase (phytanoyl-CoA dioxygenase family)
MIKTLSSCDSTWLRRGSELLDSDGVFILENVLNPALCRQLVSAAKDAYKQIVADIGIKKLQDAGESGVVRFPLKFRDEFSVLLLTPEVEECVSQFLSPFAICHLMNAILLEPAENAPTSALSLFQSTFHQDFPRYTGQVPLSLNSFFCLTNFNETNGSTQFKLGSHRRPKSDGAAIGEMAVSVTAAAGSVIFFDSTIWHAGGTNRTSSVRAGVNVQWTHHWIKQQIDLVRYLGTEICEQLSPEIRQRLGFDSRVVTSLHEYYVSPQHRLYKGGQG